MSDAAAPGDGVTDDDPGDDIYDDRISELPGEPKPKREVFADRPGHGVPEPTTERDIDDLGSVKRRG